MKMTAKQNDQIKPILNLLKDVDFSRIRNNTKGDKLSKLSGLEFINNLVKEILQNNSNQYFFEFSLISSTINPKTSELFSFSAIHTDDIESSENAFADKIGKNVSCIINTLYPTTDANILSDDDKINLLAANWFHNPELFLFPTIDDVKPFHVTDTGFSELKIDNSDNNNRFEKLSGKGLYVANMSYERNLFEMLRAARRIVLNCTREPNVEEKLIDEYHNGARMLKYAYDKYFQQQGEQYGFMAFPILSTNNKDLSNFYNSLLLDSTIEDQGYKDYFAKTHVCGIGHFFLYYKKEKDFLCDDIINELFYKVNLTLGLVSINHVFSTGLVLSKKAREESLKSAKAAIMSRNMSHNLGSHVMFYIKQRLESVSSIYKDGALKDLIQYEYKTTNELKEKVDELKDQLINQKIEAEMPFLVGLGRFINYLQERQDYIATIATDHIPFKSTINFKDAIYDELKPDLKSIRHKEDKTMKGKHPRNILLDYIAYSEGIQDSNQIKLWFDGFNGLEKPSDVPQELRELNVSLSGGNLGRQAFFSIMENVIRNTAKHDFSQVKGDGLKFVFHVLKDDESVDGLIAWSNKDSYRTKDPSAIKQLYEKNKNRYYIFEITIDIDNEVSQNAIDNISAGLHEEYLEPDGSMNDKSKGIKEIRISAAWMRGWWIDTAIPNNEPPAVALKKGSNGKVQYVICLPRPQKIAFVTGYNGELDSKGCQQFAMPTSEAKRKELADFELIVCTENQREELQKSVGSRILTVPDVSARTKDKTPLTDDEISRLYEDWLDNQFGNEYGTSLPQLIINDPKSYDNKQIKKEGWANDAKALNDERKVICNNTDVYSDQLVFAKHYDGSEKSQKLYEIMYKNSIFIEGISGSNSTDRLIRHDLWSGEWYVKHMTAALTRVAVFDERIYSTFVKKGSSPFEAWKVSELQEWLQKFESDVRKEEFPASFLREKINGIISKKSSERILLNNVRLLLSKNNERWEITSNEDILQKFLEILHQIGRPTDCSTATLFAQKGVWAFNIIPELEGRIIIKGYSSKEGKECDVAILSIESEENKKRIKCAINEEFANKFHFITIHQGILDKIYDGLKIQKEGLNKEDVTQCLFESFSRKALDCKKESIVGNEEPNSNKFLPQFIIHSGRSKPNEKDMPQKQPFVQFAALDYAIRDCKYTLTELLYSAHYEA